MTPPQPPPDFTIRPPVWDDLPAVVEMFNIYDEHFLGYRGATENSIETEWKTPKFDIETDVRVVFAPGGELVGYIEVWAIDAVPAHPWVWGRVHPDYQGQGIGTSMMAWAEARAAEAVDRCPTDVRVAYRSGTVSSIEEPKAIFADLGMNRIRYNFRMKIEFDAPPPLPAWSEGITVRTASKTPEDIAILTRVDIESFRDHYGFIEQPWEDELAWFTNWLENDEHLADPSLWFLAMDGDQAIGLCLCAVYDHEDRELGHVNSLGVLRSHRNRGIGEALLRHAFGEYHRRGYKGVSLGVDAENLTGALRLYKKVGMSVHRQFESYEKELRPGREISVVDLKS